MIAKGLIFALILSQTLIIINCLKQNVYSLETILSGTKKCDFKKKYDQIIDPKKLKLRWYNSNYTDGLFYTLDEAAILLIKNKEFMKNPTLNIYFSGYGASSPSLDSLSVVDSFLYVGETLTTIDYSAYSSKKTKYTDAVHNLHNIGEHISKFLVDMVKAGVSKNKIHLTGSGLGGQLAGYVARSFQRNYGSKLRRVTALDPVGPCFDEAALEENVKKNDAEFVDIYFSNRGQLGTIRTLGHSNFFINKGGPTQPSCEKETYLKIISDYNRKCAHLIAVIDLWKHSIENTESIIVATKCYSVEDAIKGDCDGDLFNAGYYTLATTKGVFRIDYEFDLFNTFTINELTVLLDPHAFL